MLISEKKGFTLIELLIVITIIGVLSTIILSSISNSRARAYDSKVKQQMNSFRTAAEIYFTNNNSYGTSNVCTSGVFADIDSVNGAPGKLLDNDNLPLSTEVVCGSNGSSYAVKASLYSDGQYWCVDNRGASRLIQGAIGGSATFCP